MEDWLGAGVWAGEAFGEEKGLLFSEILYLLKKMMYPFFLCKCACMYGCMYAYIYMFFTLAAFTQRWKGLFIVSYCLEDLSYLSLHSPLRLVRRSLPHASSLICAACPLSTPSFLSCSRVLVVWCGCPHDELPHPIPTPISFLCQEALDPSF